MRAASGQLKISFACLTLMLLSSGGMLASQRERWPAGAEICGETSKLFLNSNGKPVRVSAREIKARVVNRVIPTFPNACRCEGTVAIEVLVNPEGKVACARMLTGHPLLKADAVRAAEQWTFKPRLKDGRAVAFTGTVFIPIRP